MTDSPALLDAYTAEFAPSGPAETTLVQRLAVLTARLDLLARAFDTLPALHEAEAGEKHLAAQDALHDPFAAMPARNWAEARAAADPDRRYIATLRELQRLQAARRRASPAFPPSTAHLEAISDLLARGYQLLPPDHPLAPSQNEPNPILRPACGDCPPSRVQHEPNPASCPAPSDCPPSALQNEPNSAPILPHMAGAESHPRHPAAIGGPTRPRSADIIATKPQPQAPPETQNEPNLALQLPGDGHAAATSDRQNEADSICPAADQVAHPDQTHSPAVDLALHPDQTQSLPAPAGGALYRSAPLPASDLAILDRLTRHAEETILEAARHAAHHAPAGGRSVEDEIAELRSLARHLSARPAAT